MTAGDWKDAAAALGRRRSRSCGDARNGAARQSGAVPRSQARLPAAAATPAPAKLGHGARRPDGHVAAELPDRPGQQHVRRADAARCGRRRRCTRCCWPTRRRPTRCCDLLESMAVMKTPHDDAFERWLVAALERGNLGAAIEVTDRAKRRRFHNALPWGGRLAAVRDLLAAPAGALDAAAPAAAPRPAGRGFRDFAEAVDDADRAAHGAAAGLAAGDRRRRPTQDDHAAVEGVRRGDRPRASCGLGEIGLAPRAGRARRFPPLVTAAELQARLAAGAGGARLPRHARRAAWASCSPRRRRRTGTAAPARGSAAWSRSSCATSATTTPTAR